MAQSYEFTDRETEELKCYEKAREAWFDPGNMYEKLIDEVNEMIHEADVEQKFAFRSVVV